MIFLNYWGVSGDRQKDAEYRAPWLRLAFNDAPVVADDLCDQREAQPGPVGFGGHERIENMRQKVCGNSRSVIANSDFQRQREVRP